MVLHIKRPWSNFCIYVFMLLFSLSILMTVGHLQKNEYNQMKTLTSEDSYMELESLELSLYRKKPWMAGTNFDLNQFSWFHCNMNY